MITIVFGKPSCGKTAYMTADAVKYMNNSAECLELQRVSFKQVAELNAEYTLPARQPDVDDAVCLYCVLRHIALLLSISPVQIFTKQSPTDAAARRATRLLILRIAGIQPLSLSAFTVF